MAWWLMPAVTAGAVLLVKGRARAGKVRWLPVTEQDFQKTPMALALMRAAVGEELPQPPAGHRWKPVKLYVAPSPFAAPEETTLHLLERIFDGPKLGNYLTAEQARRATIPPPEVVAVAPFEWAGTSAIGSTYLTFQDVRRQEEVQRAGIYGLEAAADAAYWPREGAEAVAALKRAMAESEPELRAHGLRWAAVAPELVQKGDLLVLRAG